MSTFCWFLCAGSLTRPILRGICQCLIAGMCLTACQGSNAAKGNLVIRNDILDKEYNSFVIDKVVTSKGSKSFKHTLNPSEEVTFPFKSVVSFRLTREYEDVDRIYRVKCPSSLKRRTVVKLIDVHTNRIRGGCRLVRKGERQAGGYVKWR